ncbi:hypothetical protein SJAV_11660 [Sulfurisphaera javensis]|uniref:Carbohydrate kinase PfkB domain-containing protein n=1 Tax=Sulfurisphaera javensis TaxID=2049879 RepID=A0AAT9GQZ7_9CREN
MPIALDIQGFIRNCEVNKEIEYVKANLSPISSYFVFHSNIEEFEKSELTINYLLGLGFKELLISYNEDGFELYTRNYKEFFKTSKIGNYKTGTGDTLIASYFYYRLIGYNPRDSALKAKEFVEWFSNYGYLELFHTK